MFDNKSVLITGETSFFSKEFVVVILREYIL